MVEGAHMSVVIERMSLADLDAVEEIERQSFTTPCRDLPSQLFARLAKENPAPFGFLANLGQGEYLVGASPEMFVRVDGGRVETCPIAGTIARGTDALSDADRILELLSSDKAVSELTMCTDVDRNDKARICEPGSVRNEKDARAVSKETNAGLLSVHGVFIGKGHSL